MAVVVRSSKGEGVITERGKFVSKAGAMWSRAMGFGSGRKATSCFCFQAKSCVDISPIELNGVVIDMFQTFKLSASLQPFLPYFSRSQSRNADSALQWESKATDWSTAEPNPQVFHSLAKFSESQ